MTTKALQILTTQPNKETRCKKKTLFGCVVSICICICQMDEDIFLICLCFFYLHVFSEVAACWDLSATVLLLHSKCKILHASTHDTMMHCVSQYLVDMIVHELWSVVKTCTTFTSSWCPDVIIFFIRHLDAYNEMVVRTSYLNGRRRCVFTAQTHWHDWEQTWEVMGLWQGVAK